MASVISQGGTDVPCSDLPHAAVAANVAAQALAERAPDLLYVEFMGQRRDVSEFAGAVLVLADSVLNLLPLAPGRVRGKVELASQFVAWGAIAELMIEDLKGDGGA